MPRRCNLVEARNLTGDQLRAYTWAAHFVSVMSCYTPGVMGSGANSYVMSEPAAADKIVAGSRLLDGIAKCEPQLVNHPMQKDRQHWIASGREHAVRPTRASFGIPSAENADVKPTTCGLYTSTAMSAGYSMWRALIGLDTSGVLYRRPWLTWIMEVDTDDIRVAEILSAAKWVEFVAMYGLVRDDRVYPDWAKVAEDFDAVHITCRGCCGTGISFSDPPGRHTGGVLGCRDDVLVGMAF